MTPEERHREREGYELARTIVGRQLRLLRFTLDGAGISREDAEAQAWESVARAIQAVRYGTERHERAGLVRDTVRGDLLNMITTANRQKRKGEQLAMRFDWADDETRHAEDREAECPERAAIAKQIADLAHGLAESDIERAILDRYTRTEESHAEIGEQFGLHRQRIGLLEARFFERVREAA